jgi:hypothetical protein
MKPLQMLDVGMLWVARAYETLLILGMLLFSFWSVVIGLRLCFYGWDAKLGPFFLLLLFSILTGSTAAAGWCFLWNSPARIAVVLASAVTIGGLLHDFESEWTLGEALILFGNAAFVWVAIRAPKIQQSYARP